MSKYAVGTRVSSQKFIDNNIEMTYVYDPQPGEPSWVVDDPNPNPLIEGIFGTEIRFESQDVEEGIAEGTLIVLS